MASLAAWPARLLRACVCLLALPSPRALRARSRGPGRPAENCNGTVSFLFLARDGLPLAGVWRRYFDTCAPGSYTVHVHSQNASTPPPEWPEAVLVADPVQGGLRHSYAMVAAMNKLYETAVHSKTPSGCEPRWMQLLSESDGPVQGCAEYQALLSSSPGQSLLEGWQCETGPACNSRRIPSWPRGSPWFKASQWSTLWAEHAKIILASAPKNEPAWLNSFVPDEHYTINLLHSLGLNYSLHGLTQVYPFLPGMAAHPPAIDCRLPPSGFETHWTENGERRSAKVYTPWATMVRDVDAGGKMFARKFLSNCADNLIRKVSA